MHAIPGLRLANLDDVPVLVNLINLAFRRESFFKKGERTDPQQILEKLSTGQFHLLEERGEPIACIYLEVQQQESTTRGRGVGYIGMLAVDPERQKVGLGKQLMTFAETELRRCGCRVSQLRIVNLRAELQRFYLGLGYKQVGTTPYPEPNKLTQPAHFIDFEKELTTAG